MGSLYSKPSYSTGATSSTASSSSNASSSAADTTSTAGASTDTSASTGSSASDSDVLESITRKKAQTVMTSYRGVLEQADWLPQRKSLLGE